MDTALLLQRLLTQPDQEAIKQFHREQQCSLPICEDMPVVKRQFCDGVEYESQ